MIPVLLTAITFAFAFAFFRQQRADERAAHRWVEGLRGERLPPPEVLKGHSAAFLIAVMPYYIAQEREDARKKRVRRPYVPPAQTIIPAGGEPDCPECANGVIHEKCRSGWNDILREHLRSNASAMDADGYPDAFGDRQELRKVVKQRDALARRARVFGGVAAPPPPECQVCKDLGFFPEVNGLCPACGKKRNKR